MKTFLRIQSLRNCGQLFILICSAETIHTFSVWFNFKLSTKLVKTVPYSLCSHWYIHSHPLASCNLDHIFLGYGKSLYVGYKQNIVTETH